MVSSSLKSKINLQNTDITHQLINTRNLQINAQYNYGNTALIIACFENNTEIVKLLLEDIVYQFINQIGQIVSIKTLDIF